MTKVPEPQRDRKRGVTFSIRGKPLLSASFSAHVLRVLISLLISDLQSAGWQHNQLHPLWQRFTVFCRSPQQFSSHGWANAERRRVATKNQGQRAQARAISTVPLAGSPLVSWHISLAKKRRIANEGFRFGAEVATSSNPLRSAYPQKPQGARRNCPRAAGGNPWTTERDCRLYFKYENRVGRSLDLTCGSFL